MKVLAITFFLLFSVNAYASPFLACDPPTETDITSGQVEFDGIWEAAFEVPGCTGMKVGCVWTDPADNVDHFIFRDLAGVTDGQHSVRLRFNNVWGEGEISDPFVFNKSRPGKRQIRLIP